MSTIYGYITNTQSDQLPVGLIGQLLRALHRFCRGHGFQSRSDLNFSGNDQGCNEYKKGWTIRINSEIFWNSYSVFMSKKRLFRLRNNSSRLGTKTAVYGTEIQIENNNMVARAILKAAVFWRSLRHLIGSLSTDVFEARTPTGSQIFSSLGCAIDFLSVTSTDKR